MSDAKVTIKSEIDNQSPDFAARQIRRMRAITAAASQAARAPGKVLKSVEDPAKQAATLYAGSGSTGASLRSRTLAIDGSPGSRFVDFSFAGTALTTGEVYSVRFQAAVGRGGYQFSIDFQPGTPYAGGTLFNLAGTVPDADLRFRVMGSPAEPAAVATPEPGAVVLAASGLPVALGFWLRRRKAMRAA